MEQNGSDSELHLAGKRTELTKLRLKQVTTKLRHLTIRLQSVHQRLPAVPTRIALSSHRMVKLHHREESNSLVKELVVSLGIMSKEASLNLKPVNPGNTTIRVDKLIE